MRMSRSFGKTLRAEPTESETTSHRLLLRAGFIQQLAAGIYSSLPFGWRAQRKISNIIRDEMNRTGALEVSLPVVQPRELWEESGRADSFIPPLAQFKDRRGRMMVLAPTHEEAITTMVRSHIYSYRDLPVTLYQIQTKFRDEPRPRAGLLRVREFEMKDAYSFDATDEGLDLSFDTMVDAYRRIFDRCGLEVVMVEADSGGIGGKDSNEFILLAESGEDVILICDRCDYAANVEKAEFARNSLPHEEPGQPQEVHTPGVRTIEGLAQLLEIPTSKTIKAVFYTAGDELALVSIRGDLEVNEVKLKNVLGGVEPKLAPPDELRKRHLSAGSASGVGLDGVRSIVDPSVQPGANFVAGANREDYHLRNVNFPRDFSADIVADVATARKGDPCPRCEGTLQEDRGIEVGHVFKLGTGYSESLNAWYLDESGESRPIIMGCYGIGVGRLLAAAIEAHHDERGMRLPRAIAPYEIYLASLNIDDPEVVRRADHVYRQLTAKGHEVLYDDRDEKPGVKFNDADLLGIPLRVVVSRRGIEKEQIELKRRGEEAPAFAPADDVVRAVTDALSA